VRLLVLGGTKFLGRAVVDAALAAGHEVTLFNRGSTNPELYPEVERLQGDRDGRLDALQGREWDTVVDPSGYVPGIVRQSAELLRGAVGHYTFVSSVSAYASHAEVVTEESALAQLADGMPADALAEDYSNYGALKALSEAVVEEAFPGRASHVRAGLIVGPNDPTGRFTYWPHRLARGGEVLAPGAPERVVQLIDVRDLGEWIVRGAEQGIAGRFNAVSPPFPQHELLGSVARGVGAEPELTYVDEAFLVEREVGQWMELPLWASTAEPGFERFLETDASRAVAAGLSFRPWEETARVTLTEARLVDGVGLAPEREAALLAAWHGR
jgi:2'-hydroxyisoflavone reductase